MDDAVDDEDGALDEAWDALEGGEPERALACVDALGRDAPPRGHLVRALAWLDLGEAAKAERALADAERALDADDPDLAFARGELDLARWRLESAERAFRAVVRIADDLPSAWERLSLLADLAGRSREADRCLARAAELDPDAYPRPKHLSPAEFEALVDRAAADLPPDFQRALAELPVIIDPVPSAELASRAPLDTPADALGLFVGASALDRGSEGPGGGPVAIYLFQRNLERVCFDAEELEEQVRVTLFHELAHALGFDEEGVDAMGLG